jgi:hypothetical protein
MSNENTTTFNGKSHRKTLADQLDRLDGIIDALASGLNETVAEVVKQAVSVAVQQAVEGLVQAVLTNPELLRGLIAKVMPTASTDNEPQSAEPSEPAKPSRLARACNWVRRSCAAFQQKLGKGLTAMRKRLWVVRRFKVQLITALGVGFTAGTAAYFAGPWLAAGVSAMGGIATTLAVQAGLWFRRVLSSSATAQP